MASSMLLVTDKGTEAAKIKVKTEASMTGDSDHVGATSAKMQTNEEMAQMATHEHIEIEKHGGMNKQGPVDEPQPPPDIVGATGAVAEKKRVKLIDAHKKKQWCICQICNCG